ncbi:hypothetical protein C8T65DRAFT_696865 [Cerioporus squamosus]|nr:hypothetical protein C8T65DRAFT_696865 [Cerioporus squamosus]
MSVTNALDEAAGVHGPATSGKTRNLFDAKGKNALVTGGGSGIGAMIASVYMQNGAKVYIASRNDHATQGELRGFGQAEIWKLPLLTSSQIYVFVFRRTKAGCDTLPNQVKERESKIHMSVSNSGATYAAPYDHFPEKDDWEA